jgi:hypothetical protein
MVVDNPDGAHRVLRDAGFTVSETDVLGIEMEDVPGQLASIADILGEHDLNIDYAYAFVTRTEKAFLIIRTDNIEKALEVLGSAGIRMLDMDDIRNI